MSTPPMDEEAREKAFDMAKQVRRERRGGVAHRDGGALSREGGGRAGGRPTGPARRAVPRLGAQEMEYRVDLFGKLTANCYDKCIDKKCARAAWDTRGAGAPGGSRARPAGAQVQGGRPEHRRELVH